MLQCTTAAWSTSMLVMLGGGGPIRKGYIHMWLCIWPWLGYITVGCAGWPCWALQVWSLPRPSVGWTLCRPGGCSHGPSLASTEPSAQSQRKSGLSLQGAAGCIAVSENVVQPFLSVHWMVLKYCICGDGIPKRWGTITWDRWRGDVGEEYEVEEW